jgi:hypothetical protein
MSPLATAALAVGICFVVGLSVGAIVVFALSAVRRDRHADLDGPDDAADPELAEDYPETFGIPGRWDDPGSGARPRWPDETQTASR